MNFLRQMNSALDRLADRLQGQDVERTAAHRLPPADQSAVIASRQSAGTGPAHFPR